VNESAWELKNADKLLRYNNAIILSIMSSGLVNPRFTHEVQLG